MNTNIKNLIAIARLSTVNKNQMKQFQNIKSWWSDSSPMYMLYQYNYHRLRFLKKYIQIKQNNHSLPLKGLRILDVGCGGGFLSESMCRLGAKVIGVDPNPTSFIQATNHKLQDQTLQNLNYYKMSVQEYLQTNKNEKQSFDIVVSMEVIQHVDSRHLFLKSLEGALKCNGLMMLSTISRTPISWFSHIIVAEYLLNVVPKGTHSHNKFINTDQLQSDLRNLGIMEIARMQLRVNWKGQLQQTKGGQNYLMMGKKITTNDLL